MQDLVESQTYLELVRSSHELAEVLKERRPEDRCQIDALQHIVTRAHTHLDGLNQLSLDAADLCMQEGRSYVPDIARAGEAAGSLNNLGAAHQSLTDLKHRQSDEVVLSEKIAGSSASDSD